jgi:signal transduction histidine kinase
MDMVEVEPAPRWQTWLSYGTLLLALLLALLTRGSDLPRRPIPVILLLVVVTGAWIGWWVVLHRRWRKHRLAMVVFLIGLFALIAALVWCSPFFGAFAWTGYLYVGWSMSGQWRIAGAIPVAAIAAVSQIGGFQNLLGIGEYLIYAAVLACNVLIATVMLFVETKAEKDAARRVQMLADLEEANVKLAAALQENAGLHAQLLVQAREAGVLDERQRMAGEIHDVLAQGLTGIVTQLEAADAAATRPGDHYHHLETAKRLARESLTEARRSVQALRPQQLDGAALPEALGEVVESWSDLNGLRAELITTGTPRSLLPEIETTLLRAGQEALANVARHARAGRVALTLSYMEDVVTLDVRDDGVGFDPQVLPEVSEQGGFGLSAMRERLSRIAGTLEVESEPGGGTAISACVPALAMLDRSAA